MGRAESPISSYVSARLDLLERRRLVYAFRNNSFVGRIQRSNGTQGFIKNSKVGAPDYILLVGGGLWVGVELKSQVGRLSIEQKAAREYIESLGGAYWVIKTPEEFEAKLAEVL
jgi:hypothetical protein